MISWYCCLAVGCCVEIVKVGFVVTEYGGNDGFMLTICIGFPLIEVMVC